jgi:Uma2 family endonuclease
MATDAHDLMIHDDILKGDDGREIPQAAGTMPKVSEFVDATETLYRLTVDEYERIGEYLDRHPEAADAALVIEVADSSLAKDRRRRRTYGPAGIPVYWIVNLNSRQVEVYARPKGNGYESRTVFKAGKELPLVIDGAVVGSIAVADILP